MPAQLQIPFQQPIVGCAIAQVGSLSRSAYWVLALGILLVMAAPAASAKRVALLIGNAAYADSDRLVNPVRDAELLASALRHDGIRFDSVRVVPNAKRADMYMALSQFKKEATGADIAIVYYSGHGMINSGNVNHALPIDMVRAADNAQLDPDTALKMGAVSEDEFLDAIQGAKVQLLVLDACRDNGFAANKSGTKGLRPRDDQNPARLIAYATGQGRVAQDGQGGNSPYASSLAKHLPKADVPILGVFDAVARDVERETKGRQKPTRSGNLAIDVFLAGDMAANAHAQRQQFAVLSQRLASGDRKVLPELQRHPLFLQLARQLKFDGSATSSANGGGAFVQQADPTTVAQVVVQSQSSNPEERALAEAMAAYLQMNQGRRNQLELLQQQGNPYATLMLARVFAFGLSGTKKDEARATQLTANFKKHVPQLEALAQQGNVLAMSWLGNLYRDSTDVAEQVKAVQWFRNAADKDYPYAMAVMGHLYDKGKGGLTKDDVQATAWYRKAAKTGDVIGMRNLGWAYVTGKGGLSANDSAGSEWMRKASDAGDTNAMVGMGWMLENGKGGHSKDEVQAVHWYRKAAEAGDHAGMRMLGLMYEHGKGGLAKDAAIAVDWYRKSADGGNTGGMVGLGWLYERGQGGLPKDEVQAVHWYRKAAEAEDTVGMRLLGVMYVMGKGGLEPRDAAGGVWLGKAAYAGEAGAMTTYGWILEHGKSGVEKDEAQAVHWYRKAAEAGDSTGMANLGTMYEIGKGGLAKDQTQAIYWYRKAKDAGNAWAPEQLQRLGQ